MVARVLLCGRRFVTSRLARGSSGPSADSRHVYVSGGPRWHKMAPIVDRVGGGGCMADGASYVLLWGIPVLHKWSLQTAVNSAYYKLQSVTWLFPHFNTSYTIFSVKVLHSLDMCLSATLPWCDFMFVTTGDAPELQGPLSQWVSGGLTPCRQLKPSSRREQ